MGISGDRYLGVDDELDGADVVHAAELSFWFAAEAARLKPSHGFKLVLTVWETIPFLSTYRNRWARTYRERTLAAADLFLAATERAREGLLLEGVEPERIEVCYPGIDLERFSAATRPDPPPDEHVIISPGRLVWEKGHQDVMRALAALRGGLVPAPGGRAAAVAARRQRAGGGAASRLCERAGDRGRRRVPVGPVRPRCPASTRVARAMVLASLATASGGFYLGDLPRFFWEEQFGLVLAESMAAGLPIVASSSGAIPEVCGEAADYFLPGDWMSLARRLAEGPLSRPPGERVEHPPELVRRYSTEAMAERLTGVYDRLTAVS